MRKRRVLRLSTINRFGNGGVFVATVALGLRLLAGAVFPLAPAAEEIYKVGGDVTSPKLLHKEEPKYTKRAKKAKVQGKVLLAAVVNSMGTPENLHVVKSLDPDLDVQALNAASNWCFKPAEKNGTPVAVSIRIEVSFRLCCSW